MAVKSLELREAQGTLTPNETVMAELSDGTKLVRTGDGAGIVRPAPDENHRWEREYPEFPNARLYFGLWRETGGWEYQPESPGNAVPTEVAAKGKAAVASYLLVGTGTVYDRKYVAQKIDVQPQTVTNYAHRIRWQENDE